MSRVLLALVDWLDAALGPFGYFGIVLSASFVICGNVQPPQFVAVEAVRVCMLASLALFLYARDVRLFVSVINKFYNSLNHPY